MSAVRLASCLPSAVDVDVAVFSTQFGGYVSYGVVAHAKRGYFTTYTHTHSIAVYNIVHMSFICECVCVCLSVWGLMGLRVSESHAHYDHKHSALRGGHTTMFVGVGVVDDALCDCRMSSVVVLVVLMMLMSLLMAAALNTLSLPT